MSSAIRQRVQRRLSGRQLQRLPILLTAVGRDLRRGGQVAATRNEGTQRALIAIEATPAVEQE